MPTASSVPAKLRSSAGQHAPLPSLDADSIVGTAPAAAGACTENEAYDTHQSLHSAAKMF
jgi:hypothetical protein